jgi:PAS domain S-box-containing protein
MEQHLNGILFESVQCGIIVMDAETNIVVNINDVACHVLQLDKSIIGSPCHKMLCNNLDECEFKKVIDYKVDKSEVCFMTKIQKRKWLLRTANKVSSNGKNYIIESFTDITPQKLMEQNYLDLVNYAPAGIYQLDLKTFEYKPINQVILDYTGYTKEEFKENGLFVVLTNESKELFLDRMKRIKEGEEVSNEVEYEIKTKQGKRYWVLLNVRFIYNGDPIPTDAFCIVTDITKRKDAEIKLLNEKNKAQMYLDMAFDIVVALNLEGQIILINKSGCDTLKSSEDKLLGLNWFDNFVPSDDIYSAKNEFEETIKGLNGEKERTWQNFIITTTGEKRFIRWKNKPVKDDNGNIVGTFSTGDDITDERKAETSMNNLWDKTQKELNIINPILPFRRRTREDRNNKLNVAINLITNGD